MQEDTIGTQKHTQAIALVAELFDLDAAALAQRGSHHTLLRTLERIGYRWNGTNWQHPRRPWMYAFVPAEDAPQVAEDIPQAEETAEAETPKRRARKTPEPETEEEA